MTEHDKFDEWWQKKIAAMLEHDLDLMDLRHLVTGEVMFVVNKKILEKYDQENGTDLTERKLADSETTRAITEYLLAEAE